MKHTRERIIDAAIELFNESGTAATSTNHIAAALGISPGNLYYHFRNKEAIIRAIFARMTVAWGEVNAVPAGRPPTVADLRRLFEGNFDVLWRYRFYYRESLALFQRDPLLKEEYRAVRRQGFRNIETLIDRLRDAGVVRADLAPDAAADLAQTCWLLADFWLPFAELDGEPVGSGHLRRGVALVMRVLEPYLTPAARADLDRSIVEDLTPVGGPR